MSEERRGPGVGAILAGLLLIGSIAGSAWWLNRPKPTGARPIDPDKLDVFCNGRVDASSQVIALEPTTPGRVVSLGKGVSEGATIAAGQPVLYMDDSLAKHRLAQSEVAVNLAELELNTAIAEKARVPKMLGTRKLLLDAAKERMIAAEKALQLRKEQQTVLKAPLGPTEEAGMKAQIREMELLFEAEEKQFQELKDREDKNEGSELRIRMAKARLEAAKSDRAFAEQSVKDCVVKAPADGTILRLQASVGGLLSPGNPFPPVIFAPAGTYIVRAEIDQESLGRVQVGMQAEIQEESRADVPPLKGKVKFVAGWVAQRRFLVTEPGDLSDIRTVECVVELDSANATLWIGQRMRVRIIRDPARASR
jgi:multidrug resistance efflux pump